MVIVRPEAIDAALGSAKPQRSEGRRLTAFLLREEWAPAQGKKAGGRRCGSGERGAAGLRSDLTIEEAAKVTGLIMQTGRKAVSNIGGFKKVGAAFHGEVARLASRPRRARFAPEAGRTGENPPIHLISIGGVEIARPGREGLRRSRAPLGQAG